MSDVQPIATSEAQNHGQSMSVIVGADARPLLFLFAGLSVFNLVLATVALVVNLLAAPQLFVESGALKNKSDNLTRYMVQVAYWMQRVEVEAEKQGVKLPPAPQQPKD